jgi:hypothetical protein
MDGQFHAYIGSNDSTSVFPENNGANFRVNLHQPIDFTNGDEWYVALTNITVHSE